MDHPKKVLILFAGAGHGHQKAAEAVLEACKGCPEQIAARVVDTLSLTPGFPGGFYKQIYFFQIRYVPWLWGFFYYSIDMRWLYSVVKGARRVLNGLMARRLERLLIEEDPSVVVAAHFMAAEVASHLKKKGLIKSKIITVVTDYLPHYVWTADHVDFYVVALEETKEALLKRGVAAGKIRVLGIPIEQKFLKSQLRELLFEKFSLKKNRFTVLITSGGAGIGAIGRLTEELLALGERMQLLVVCGTNQMLLDYLRRKADDHPSLKIFGFVNNMEELMEVSDLVIGKGGGLTVTESLVKGKPLVLFQSVPGQESRNEACVRKYGAGYAVRTSRDVVDKVSEILNDPEKLEQLRDGVRRMAKPGAAAGVRELILNECGL